MIESLSEAYKKAIPYQNGQFKFEISRDVYYDALEVLPPVYGKAYKKSQFWVGEPYSNDALGRPTALECWREEDKYYCRISTMGV
jgi:hypothetical protein